MLKGENFIAQWEPLTGRIVQVYFYKTNTNTLRCVAVQMELPFSSFELTFIIIAFVIFSLFSLASICVQPQEGTKPPVVRYKRQGSAFLNPHAACEFSFRKRCVCSREVETVKQEAESHHQAGRKEAINESGDFSVLRSSNQWDDAKWLETWKPCGPFCF